MLPPGRPDEFAKKLAQNVAQPFFVKITSIEVAQKFALSLYF
jgi:hypothetical protein